MTHCDNIRYHRGHLPSWLKSSRVFSTTKETTALIKETGRSSLQSDKGSLNLIYGLQPLNQHSLVVRPGLAQVAVLSVSNIPGVVVVLARICRGLDWEAEGCRFKQFQKLEGVLVAVRGYRTPSEPRGPWVQYQTPNAQIGPCDELATCEIQIISQSFTRNPKIITLLLVLVLALLFIYGNYHISNLLGAWCWYTTE